MRPNPDELDFYESTHRYFYKGRELKSVTQALESVGITDFSKVAWEVLERATLIGDYVHELARLHARKELDESTIDPHLAGYYEGIKRFFKERVRRVLKVEANIVDLKFGYAGRFDILYLSKENRVCLDDYTTGQINHLAKRLQTAPYQRSAELNYRLKIRERASVVISPTGDYNRTVYKKRTDFDDFVHVLAVCALKDGGKKNP